MSDFQRKPIIGHDYIVCFNGVWQHVTYRFDSGDEESFWEFVESEHGEFNKTFEPEKDKWITVQGAVEIIESLRAQLTEANAKLEAVESAKPQADKEKLEMVDKDALRLEIQTLLHKYGPTNGGGNQMCISFCNGLNCVLEMLESGDFDAGRGE